MDFTDFEDRNGLRFSFNVLPTNRVDANSCCFPLGALYTPLKQISDFSTLQYEPVACKHCHAYLNHYSYVNFERKTWNCPICKSMNPLPKSYYSMTPDCLCAELMPNCSTVEYTLRSKPVCPPSFFFVVDTCMNDKEFSALKSEILQAIDGLPSNSLVGLITYGPLVNLYEINFAEFPHCFTFNGTKVYPQEQIRHYLSIGSVDGKIVNNVLVPLHDTEKMLTSIIENLESNPFDFRPFQVEKGTRSQRCTGAALDLALTLLELILPKANSRIMLFTAGPITKGPGKMAEIDRKINVRQHQDIDQNKAQMSDKSREFFQNIANRACANYTIINLISASFEESGIYEMTPVVYQTGGFLLSNESFTEENVSKTLLKYFKGGVLDNSGSVCILTIRSNDIFKLSGCIGPCYSNSLKTASVSSNMIGIGGTSQWRTCGILPQTTFAIYFDIANSKVESIPPDEVAYIQFSTRYRHFATGDLRLRVTTASLKFADLKTNRIAIINGIDQEASAVLFAKMLMFPGETNDSTDKINIMDRKIVNFCKQFGDYIQNEPRSFQLAQHLQFLPQFIFHFRRSPFLNTFNSSPDQTSFMCHSLLSEDVNNSLFMIQPSLLKYSLINPPTPVMLDASSLETDCVLLFDSYFRVLIWKGSNIVVWENKGYHEQEEYQNLRAALNGPNEEAKLIVAERFPTPQFHVCIQDSPLSRYILSRCNPSNEITFAPFEPMDILNTDELSYSNFVLKLRHSACA